MKIPSNRRSRHSRDQSKRARCGHWRSPTCTRTCQSLTIAGRFLCGRAWTSLKQSGGTQSRIIFERKVARLTGLEPATPGVTGRYSNQLSYNRAMSGGIGHRRQCVKRLSGYNLFPCATDRYSALHIAPEGVAIKATQRPLTEFQSHSEAAADCFQNHSELCYILHIPKNTFSSYLTSIERPTWDTVST